MKDNFNNLTPAETERLAILMEECAEVQQIIGKILRHGYESHNPFDEEKKTNRELLEIELGDIECICRLMMKEDDVSRIKIAERASEKEVNISNYLHHNITEHQKKENTLLVQKKRSVWKEDYDHIQWSIFRDNYTECHKCGTWDKEQCICYAR